MIPLTRAQRYEIASRILAQTVAERVVQKLLERQKTALVVFTGSNMNFQESLTALNALRKQGFTFHVLLTRSAARMLDQAEILAQLQPKSFWIEQADACPEVLTLKFDTIIVPAMTVNAAAHVASCMADTPATAIIFDGMMRGKNVVIAVDGCCPDNPLRKERGFAIPEPLKQKLRDNLTQIQSYGAKLTTADGLYEKTLKTIFSGFVPSQGAKRTPTPVTPSGAYQGGKVLSGAYILTHPSHSTLLVPKGTLVTQMAKEEARRRDIRIQIQS